MKFFLYMCRLPPPPFEVNWLRCNIKLKSKAIERKLFSRWLLRRGGGERCYLWNHQLRTTLKTSITSDKAKQTSHRWIGNFFFLLLPLSSSINRFMKQQEKKYKLTFHVFLLALNCFLVEKHIKTSFSRQLNVRRVWRESKKKDKELKSKLTSFDRESFGENFSGVSSSFVFANRG